jgi:hypothetical protein
MLFCVVTAEDLGTSFADVEAIEAPFDAALPACHDAPWAITCLASSADFDAIHAQHLTTITVVHFGVKEFPFAYVARLSRVAFGIKPCGNADPVPLKTIDNSHSFLSFVKQVIHLNENQYAPTDLSYDRQPWD